MKYYTNVTTWGGKILYRGIDNKHPVRYKVDYRPTLFLPSKEPTGITTIFGEPVKSIQPGSIKDCREFIDKYKDVDGFRIYGNTQYEYNFIADEQPEDDIEWDISDLNIADIDIEVYSEDGFPEAAIATWPVTAITHKARGVIHVFGCGEFTTTRKDVVYHKFQDEISLLKGYISFWSSDYPDAVTGWNIRFFDLPYLVNRIRNIIGEEWAKKLSPWNVINDKFIDFGPGREFKTYTLLGISALDYIDLYQRYAPEGKSQESYKLDAIGMVELGQGKLSYAEEGSLYELYKTNYQKYIEYNIQDVELVEKLEDKLRLIELAITLAYDSKTNFEDAFSQVRMWHILCYNHLRKSNRVMPPTEDHSKSERYEGAYVKETLNGEHKWVAGFDLTSLYPSLIMMYNLSPETLIGPSDYTDNMRRIWNEGVSVEKLLAMQCDLRGLKEDNVTVTPNGQFFTTKFKGFMPEMTEKMFADRQRYKDLMKVAKKELQKETDPAKRFDIEKRISRYNNLQLSKKVCLNSLYGAMGTPYFKFFDLRIAIAITTGGQYSIQWIQNKVNLYMNKILQTEDVDYVIASDTDSIYLSLDRLVKAALGEKEKTQDTRDTIRFMDRISKEKIQPYIDKSYQELATYVNAYAQKMLMKREALADRAIWVAKKRYILNVWDNEGVEYAEPEIKVMGLEVKKSSTPKSCRTKLTEAIRIILNGTEADIIKFIKTYKEEFKTLPVSEIAFPRGVNGIKKYMAEPLHTPIHVRGSIVYNNLLQTHNLQKKYPTIKDGEKIKFLYLKEPNTIGSNIIACHDNLPKELDMDRYIDYNTQYQKAFVEPLKIILDAIGWHTEKVNKLSAFAKKG